MKDYIEANRRNWNDRVAAHLEDREYYDVESFLAGKSTLHEIELSLAGDVKGKELLHLMCHFGLDTLSWARMGARVTGLDFSPKAIEAARELADRTGLDAKFVISDVNHAAEAINEKFDIVVSCYGILAWLADMDRFVRQAVSCLKPGGRLVLVDLHPMLTTLEPDEETGVFSVIESYFAKKEPEKCDFPHSYANREAILENAVSYQWNHSIAEIVTACLDNGLTIEHLGEYAYSNNNIFPGHMVREYRRWFLKNSEVQFPMLFSLRGRL